MCMIDSPLLLCVLCALLCVCCVCVSPLSFFSLKIYFYFLFLRLFMGLEQRELLLYTTRTTCVKNVRVCDVKKKYFMI